MIPSLNAVTGGPAIACLNISRKLVAAGHNVTIFATNWPDAGLTGQSLCSQASAGGVKVESFPTLRSPGTAPLPCSPAMVKAARHCRNKFDFIICHSLWNPVATFVMSALRREGAPYLLMPHGTLDPLVFGRHRPLKCLCGLLWERANVEGASAVIFNSESERKKARGFGWRLERTSVFPHLVDLAYWKDLPERSVFERRFPQVKGREVILFVGRIDWVKNLDVLLESLQLVRQSRPTAMLVCVGPSNGGYRKRLEWAARSLDLYEHVLFTGMQLADDLKAAYARGDVFALVSKKENFGLAAAEALACGLPVVLSEGVDLGEDLQGRDPVCRVQPLPSAIAGKLVQMLERTARLGLPDLEALSLARNQFGPKPLSHLLCHPGVS